MNESFHIAFGTKIGKPPTAGVGRKSTSSGLPSPSSMRSSAGASSRESYGRFIRLLPVRLYHSSAYNVVIVKLVAVCI